MEETQVQAAAAVSDAQQQGFQEMRLYYARRSRVQEDLGAFGNIAVQFVSVRFFFQGEQHIVEKEHQAQQVQKGSGFASHSF